MIVIFIGIAIVALGIFIYMNNALIISPSKAASEPPALQEYISNITQESSPKKIIPAITTQIIQKTTISPSNYTAINYISYSIPVVNDTITISQGSFKEIPYVVRDILHANSTGATLNGQLEVIWPLKTDGVTLNYADQSLQTTFSAQDLQTMSLARIDKGIPNPVNFNGTNILPVGKRVYIEIQNPSKSNSVTVKVVVNAKFVGNTPIIPENTQIINLSAQQSRNSKLSLSQAISITKLNTDKINTSSLEKRIHELINAYRISHGLSILTFDDKLASIAREHSQDMATNNYFEHNSLLGIDPSERALVAGYSCYKSSGTHYTNGIGENIWQGWLYYSITYIDGIPQYDWLTQELLAHDITDGWFSSEGHRENILTSTYDREGVGILISSDGKVLATEDFC